MDAFKAVPKLQSIVVFDRDGVVLIRETSSRGQGEAAVEEGVDDVAATAGGSGGSGGSGLSSEHASNFAQVLDHAARLNMGSCKTMSTFFSNKIIVHVNCSPLVVLLVASQDVNVAKLHRLAPALTESLEVVRKSTMAQESIM